MGDEARKEEEALLNAKPDTLPRHILVTNNKYFDILFRDCLQSKSDKIQKMAWKLILRLPTNPSRKQKLYELPQNVQCDWDKLLPPHNLHHLVYGVLICESLTIDPEKNDISDTELQQRVNWRASFLQNKGFEHLIKILFTLKYDNNYLQQLALTAVLKMIQSFFVGAISCNQSMGDVVDQIRSLSLNVNSNKEEIKQEEPIKKKKRNDSEQLYEMGVSDYAYLIDSDEESEENENDDKVTEDFTALLEQQFADSIMKASGMPESLYNATKNEW